MASAVRGQLFVEGRDPLEKLVDQSLCPCDARLVAAADQPSQEHAAVHPAALVTQFCRDWSEVRVALVLLLELIKLFGAHGPHTVTVFQCGYDQVPVLRLLGAV